MDLKKQNYFHAQQGALVNSKGISYALLSSINNLNFKY